jgi:hypothetical protein
MRHSLPRPHPQLLCCLNLCMPPSAGRIPPIWPLASLKSFRRSRQGLLLHACSGHLTFHPVPPHLERPEANMQPNFGRFWDVGICYLALHLRSESCLQITTLDSISKAFQTCRKMQQRNMDTLYVLYTDSLIFKFYFSQVWAFIFMSYLRENYVLHAPYPLIFQCRLPKINVLLYSHSTVITVREFNLGILFILIYSAFSNFHNYSDNAFWSFFPLLAKDLVWNNFLHFVFIFGLVFERLLVSVS